MPNIKSLESKLLQLRDKFVEALPQRIDALSIAIARCQRDGDGHDDLTRQFHSLAGTAATHGLVTIGALAAEGEEACGCLAEETFAYLSSLVDSMRAAAAALRESGRILCVEDDEAQAAYIRTILEDSGYEVRTIDEPRHLDLALSAFHPDLVLMDIMLPDISGVELARSIRSDPAYATMPIVFLTHQNKTESRIAAVAAGGDDFLTKPVVPELLLSIVSARLKSWRAVQLLIDHDGLTGALTHAAFMRRAQSAMARRNDEEIALVMVDLDHFKSINDCHGHLAGDQVLSAFASFLSRNVRTGDEVGRYGGEEFALLLRNIACDDVQSLVTRLLEDFSLAEFRGARGATFHVTFSAGVAMLERRLELDQWKQRADDALYSAKHHGRARVEAA